MYHKAVVDHYEKPRNVGSFDKNDPNVGTGLVGEWSARNDAAWGDSSVVSLQWYAVFRNCCHSRSLHDDVDPDTASQMCQSCAVPCTATC
jgi:hypothetical protein